MSILDLSVVKEKETELILPSGKHLHLLRPNLRLVGYVNNYRNLVANIKNQEELSELINEMSSFIINNNREKYTLTPREEKLLDEMDRLQIINSYMEFIERIATNPN